MGEIAGPVFSSAVQGAIQELSKRIMVTAQFKTWDQKLRDVASDRTALDLAEQVRHLQGDVRRGAMRQPIDLERKQRLDELMASYEDLPVVIEYRLAEAQFRSLCVQVNADVSEGLGVDFASHCARGCCG